MPLSRPRQPTRLSALVVATTLLASCGSPDDAPDGLGTSALPDPPNVLGPTARTPSGAEGTNVVAKVGEPVTIQVTLTRRDGSPLTDYTLDWSQAGTRSSPAPGVETLTLALSRPGFLQVLGTVSTCNGTPWVPHLHCADASIAPVAIQAWGGDATALTFATQAAAMGVGEVRPIQASATAILDEPRRTSSTTPIVAFDPILYAVADPTIASVDERGFVTALRAGQTTLHATVGPPGRPIRLSATLTLTITDAALERPPVGDLVLPGAGDQTYSDIGRGIRSGALALAPNEWPTLVFADPEIGPEAWVLGWTGTGFGRERASAAPDVATHARLATAPDGALWVSYLDTRTNTWVASERTAPGAWRTTRLPPNLHDAADTLPTAFTETAASDDTPLQTALLALSPAPAAAPEGGAWLAYVLRYPRVGSGQVDPPDAERHLRIARVVAGRVTAEDIETRCLGSAPGNLAPAASCTDPLARDLPRGLWFVAGADATPRLVVFDADSTVAVWTRGPGGTWARQAVLPRPSGNPFDDRPSEFTILPHDPLAPGSPDVWAWLSPNQHGLLWQSVAPANLAPDVPAPLSNTQADHNVAAPNDPYAATGNALIPGAVAVDGTTWVARASLAPMVMTLPDGTQTLDQLAAWVPADPSGAYDPLAVSSAHVGALVACPDRFHLVHADTRGLHYANFARVLLCDVDASDAVGSPGRALTMASYERVVTPPIIAPDGRRMTIAASTPFGATAYLMRTASSRALPWSGVTWLDSTTAPPVLIAHAGEVFMTGPTLFPQVRRLEGDTWKVMQSCQSGTPLVALGAADDGAVWAFSEDRRLYRIAPADGLGMAPEVGVGTLPFGLASGEAGMTTSGNVAFVVAKDNPFVVANRYDASGLVDGTARDGTLAPDGIDLAHPAATPAGGVCLLRMTSAGVVATHYQGEVLCSDDLFRAVPDAPDTAYTRTSLGAGDWLTARLGRMQDDRLIVTVTRAASTLRDEALVYVSNDGVHWSDAIALRPAGGYGQSPVGCAPEEDGTLLCLVEDNLGHSNWRWTGAAGFPASPAKFPIAVHVEVGAP